MTKSKLFQINLRRESTVPRTVQEGPRGLVKMDAPLKAEHLAHRT
jgi:hypothetical protein